jgi:hypothetical protein
VRPQPSRHHDRQRAARAPDSDPLSPITQPPTRSVGLPRDQRTSSPPGKGFSRRDQGLTGLRRRARIQRVLHDVWDAGDPLNILYNWQTGKSVAYSADTTETDDFAVPGDFGSVMARFTRKIVSVTLPGGGLVVHDVGVFTFAPNDVILEDHGPKMVFFGQTEELCAALA